MPESSVNKKVGIIIQARMRSQRLPGKVMLELCGKSVIERIIERLKNCRNSSVVIVATTEDSLDDALAEAAERSGAEVFRGSQDDVLSRYYQAALENKLDIIVRVTGDSPLIDPAIVDSLIEGYLHSGAGYFSNTLKHTFPLGFSAEVFSFDALKEAHLEAKESYQREHVTPYIYEHPARFKVKGFESEINYPGFRLTLDTPEDYRLIKAVYAHFASEGKNFGLEQIVEFLKEEPGLAASNAHIKQKKLCE